MAIRAQYCKHTLNFKFDAGTSRGVLKKKDSLFLRIFDSDFPGVSGLGEAGPLPGLSPDYGNIAETTLSTLVRKINSNVFNISEISILLNDLRNYPSVLFALETALADLKHGGKRCIFTNDFFDGSREIEINGLIWMGKKEFMASQIAEKLRQGYHTLKMKIGAIDFESEMELLSSIREEYDREKITLRVDANGAFSPEEALKKLDRLAQLDIHSIEQPIRQGQISTMAELCRQSPVPVALDEELIGITSAKEKERLLQVINPPYIILKPTLTGGFSGTSEWITLAEKLGTGWWITSALESNIGLNAICQYTAEFDNPLPQGLGTGQLYTNNIGSPLSIKSGKTSYNQQEKWDLSLLHFKD